MLGTSPTFDFRLGLGAEAPSQPCRASRRPARAPDLSVSSVRCWTCPAITSRTCRRRASRTLRSSGCLRASVASVLSSLGGPKLERSTPAHAPHVAKLVDELGSSRLAARKWLNDVRQQPTESSRRSLPRARRLGVAQLERQPAREPCTGRVPAAQLASATPQRRGKGVSTLRSAVLRW